MDFKQTVLEEGMNIFHRYGINSLTMETILENLDISKGTFAEIAKSKDELLDQCIEAMLAQRKEQFANIIEQAENAVEAISTLLKANLKANTGHHPDFLPDLRNSHQPCWKKMESFSEQHLVTYLNQLLQIGMEQQLFKPEINPALISKLLLSQTYAIVEAGLIDDPATKFSEVYKMGFEYYLRGLLTPQGTALLESKAREMAFAL